jgi:hypothetical protein
MLVIGETRLKGWVDGMTAQPMNLDYRLWSWTINMKLSPVYVPRPVLQGRGAQRQVPGLGLIPIETLGAAGVAANAVARS